MVVIGQAPPPDNISEYLALAPFAPTL